MSIQRVTVPQVLHDGYLRTGVPGWGTAYEYAAVSQTDPQSIMNFLRTRAEEQVLGYGESGYLARR